MSLFDRKLAVFCRQHGISVSLARELLERFGRVPYDDKIAKLAWTLANAGKSLREIARELVKAGVKPKGGGKSIHPQTIQNLLKRGGRRQAKAEKIGGSRSRL